jgi:DNA-binding SARP family transcriptional activator
LLQRYWGKYAMTKLSISLFGSFQVIRNGKEVTHFGSDTARALLAYLAMYPNKVHRRDVLAGLLWPEQPNTDALRNLRVALSRLRDAIGDRQTIPPFLEVTSQTIQLNADTNYSLDTRLMNNALSLTKVHNHVRIENCDMCAKQFQVAADLYRGEFLEGFSLDSIPFEEWMIVTRENFHWQALEVLSILSAYHANQGNYQEAIECARRQVELEPWREEAHRQWMRALALSGHRGAALTQFDICRKVMAEELGVEPEAETLELYRIIRAGQLTPPNEAVSKSATATDLITTIHSPVLPEGQAAKPESAMQPDVSQMPVSERRTVTCMRVELKSSTGLRGQVSTEDWATIASQLLRTAGTVIHRYDGQVERYDSDGLVALFGVQTAHEDDPEHGVLAAILIQQALLAQFTQFSDGKSCFEMLEVKIGVHTGEVIVTTIDGEGGSGHRTVIGDAVQYTMQMLAKISPSVVVVSEKTYRLIAHLFEWASEDTVKGYIPLTRRKDADKGRGWPGMRSRMVGRLRESRVLNQAVEQLQSGTGGIITLVGEAGIGKSRLIAEVRKSSSVNWIEGRCLSYSRLIPYSLWQTILYCLLGVTADTHPSIIDHALRQRIKTLDLDHFQSTYAYLGKLLALPLRADMEALINNDAQNLNKGIFDAVELVLEATAQQQPFVIVCEDLHWADPISLDLLGQLLRMTGHSALLFICVFRPEGEHNFWRTNERIIGTSVQRYIDLRLEPLSITEGEKLLKNLLLSLPGPEGRKPVEGLPNALKLQILNRGEGNPFYIEEVLRALVRSGTIKCHEVSCRWEVDQPIEDIKIPETLYGVLQSRIDQLPKKAQYVLQLASVIGRSFSYPLLAYIADRSVLDENLEILQREQLIQEQTHLPEREFIFQHQLTLEAVYDGLLHRTRRVLHRRVAQAL